MHFSGCLVASGVTDVVGDTTERDDPEEKKGTRRGSQANRRVPASPHLEES